MNTNEQSERDAFEAKMKNHSSPAQGWWFRQLDDGGYSAERVDDAWAAWKARAALASQQPAAVSSAMVDRFLTWPVPADVRPDGTTGKPGRTGTNLLTAQQARIMLEHVLAVPPSERLEHGVTTAQAMEAVDALEAAARGDEPYSHFAGALIRSALLASSPAQPQPQQGDCPGCKGTGTTGDHNGERYVEVQCDRCNGTGRAALPPAPPAYTHADVAKAHADGYALGLKQQDRPQPEVPKEIDVRTILLHVVPGEDGMGEEVFAKSVADVEKKLGAMGEELEDWRLGIRRYQPEAVPQGGQWPTNCDGKEQEAFEAWAKRDRYDMALHPLHWLFLNERTNAARQGWKAALAYVNTVMLVAAPPSPQPPAEQALVPRVTAHNVGQWCKSEDDCIAQGIDFPAYEQGVADAAEAMSRQPALPPKVAQWAKTPEAETSEWHKGYEAARSWVAMQLHGIGTAKPAQPEFAGMPVTVNPDLPPGDVVFKDAQGKAVGTITNLAQPVQGVGE